MSTSLMLDNQISGLKEAAKKARITHRNLSCLKGKLLDQIRPYRDMEDGTKYAEIAGEAVYSVSKAVEDIVDAQKAIEELIREYYLELEPLLEYECDLYVQEQEERQREYRQMVQ